MAYVRAHYGKAEVRFKIKGQRYVTTIPLTPTQANIKATRSRVEGFEARLKAGEPWECVRSDLREQRSEHNPAKANIPMPIQTFGYYAQHFLDHVEVERPTLIGYQSIFDRYWLPFDRRPIDALAKSELVSHLSKFKAGWKTRRSAVGVLRGIFEVAKDDHVIQEAPTDRWVVKKGQQKSPDP